MFDSIYEFRAESVPEAKIDGLTGGETLASRALTAALWEVFCLEVPVALCVLLACQIARMGLSGRPFPSVRLTVSIWSFSGFQYGLSNDEGVLGIIFIVFETTERIPFRFKVFLLIPLTNRVSSRIIGSGWDFPHIHIALSNPEVMIMETIREYDAKLDSKKRITLRGKPFDYYHVAELEDGRIILEPRELAIPFEVSQKTLAMMDEAVANLKKGTVSETIDLSEFDD